jgi:hypothetical protein
MAGVQMKCTIYQAMGDHDAARLCISQIETYMAHLMLSMRSRRLLLQQKRHLLFRRWTSLERTCTSPRFPPMRKWISPMQKLMTVRLSKMWRSCMPLMWMLLKCRKKTVEKRGRLCKLFMY